MIIESEIVKWYLANKRDLPWRNTTNPYKIWVSEIILQQTRVDQALSYYLAFLNEFPNILALANASQQQVLKLWQGLGYYSRARNMHFTAQYIINELDGIFPDSYSELIKLKGIGEYTAAAIASFAFNENVPALDGNVYRVLARLFAEKSPINSPQGKKIFKELACELIKNQDPSVFNQAMMEFGALQCVPKNPNCRECPLNSACTAKIQNMVKEFPVKINKLIKKDRFINYFFIENQQYTYIKLRDKKDIWNGLFEFPMIESNALKDFSTICQSEEWKDLFGNIKLVLHSVSDNMIHQLTHQKIHAVFYRLSFTSSDNYVKIDKEFKKVGINELKDYPVSKIIENYIKQVLN
jgi:A/G-specific adenine glycosylase